MLPLDEAKQQLTGLMTGESDLIANAANFSAFLNEQLETINWLGFYFLKEGELVLGPFQGRPACVRIPVGKGVCGTAVAERRTQVVADVHAFPGHIACDVRSRSEVVVPLWQGDEVVGVLDIDSPVTDRFDAGDVAYIEALASCFCEQQFA
ncbi:GAF domain-containing protein [Parahaliea maris]|uniref:GAF domain-containing protein n=1 Tax=Parahaliea maris TaxID=2716870 RepID=A0A5C8ZNW6_9GAMM|nr:GAF domain-containing protein [Parahaliea maris]TXS89257.1 GAF domain-containing protein [Parahaliea maris]